MLCLLPLETEGALHVAPGRGEGEQEEGSVLPEGVDTTAVTVTPPLTRADVTRGRQLTLELAQQGCRRRPVLRSSEATAGDAGEGR